MQPGINLGNQLGKLGAKQYYLLKLFVYLTAISSQKQSDEAQKPLIAGPIKSAEINQTRIQIKKEKKSFLVEVEWARAQAQKLELKCPGQYIGLQEISPSLYV